METVIQVGGVSCGGCVASIQRALGALPGVSTVAVDLGTQRVTVQHDATQAPEARLRAAILDAGYEVPD